MQVGSEADRPTMSNNRKLLVYIMMKAPCLTFDMMIKIARAVYDFHVHLSLYTFTFSSREFLWYTSIYSAMNGL